VSSHLVKVSQNVVYVPDDDHSDNPLAAVVTKLLPATRATAHRIDLAYWCPDRNTWLPAKNVPAFEDSNGDVNEHYYRPVTNQTYNQEDKS
jgi:hypothetical protein